MTLETMPRQSKPRMLRRQRSFRGLDEPLGYPDGLNAYTVELNAPTHLIDPQGTDTQTARLGFIISDVVIPKELPDARDRRPGMTVQWKVKGGDKDYHGYLIQHVLYSLQIWDTETGFRRFIDEQAIEQQTGAGAERMGDPPHKIDDSTVSYWERWDINANTPMAHLANGKFDWSFTDNFYMPPPKRGTRGILSVQGWAKLVPNAPDWKPPYPGLTGGLPGSYVGPDGWKDDGITIYHKFYYTWCFRDQGNGIGDGGSYPEKK